MRALIAVSILCASPLLADPVVIGHPNLSTLDRVSLQRIYTGKVVELNGSRVFPVDLRPGDRLRQRFLELYLDQDEDKYIGYWTVRRYVGKGTPPRELDSPEAVIQYVSQTPGAIGYVDESALKAGLNVLSTPP
jgi:ABC-type phosphate transport system substrate-binding protein